MSSNGIPAETLSNSSPSAIATSIAKIDVTMVNDEELDQLSHDVGSAAGGVLPHNTWIRARANFA